MARPMGTHLFKMKPPSKSLATGIKLFLAFAVISLVAFWDYRLFLDKAGRIELYDELTYHINSIKVSITRLEYTLDMFVVARRFEDTTVGLIKKDVQKLDSAVMRVVENPAYMSLFEADAFAYDEVISFSEDWQRVKDEIAALDEAMNQSEVILIHNAVDVNTILINEKSDRLLDVIAESRGRVFAETRSLAVMSLGGFVFICFFAALVFYNKVISPLNSVAATAEGIASGGRSARFGESSAGVTGRLARSLNKMLDAMDGLVTLRDDEAGRLAGEMSRKNAAIEALNVFSALAGKSISLSDMYGAAVTEAVGAGIADAAVIYLREKGDLRLKASEGFDDFFLAEGSEIPAGALKGSEEEREAHLYADLEDFPYERFGKVLKSCGFSALLSLPICSRDMVLGYLYALSKDKNLTMENTSLLKAMAASLGSYTCYIDLFQREHGLKKFLERLINQVPFGLAVFDKAGRCVVLNNVLKKFLGTDPKFDFPGKYCIFEDEVLKSQGMVTSIKKSYEGFATEFIIKYDPSLVKRFRLSGKPRRLKIKAFPLYDAGGEISNISLIYEDVSMSEGSVSESGERG